MFKIGQKVVCKTLKPSLPDGVTSGIEVGKIYQIESKLTCSCGGKHLLLKGIDTGSSHLCKCENSLPSNAYFEWRFEPLKFGLISNAEIIKEIISEKSDLPLKEPVLTDS